MIVMDKASLFLFVTILNLIMNFGSNKESQYAEMQKEVISLTAVVGKEDPDDPKIKHCFDFTKKDLENYNALVLPKSWIYCESQIASVDSFVLQNWQERLFVERLERKYIPIEQLLTETENNWEAVSEQVPDKNAKYCRKRWAHIKKRKHELNDY